MKAIATAPAHLGVYRIEATLGEGGMGEVFLARDERLERYVAVKRIRKDKLDDHHLVRFRREARAVARLNHPAIVQIYDVFDSDGGECIVMEHVDGDSLAAILGGEGLALPLAVQLAIEIADGLGEAHAKGLVHRDLKAANVIVTSSGHAKILDFGLARMASLELGETTLGGDPSLTRSGALMGTAYAMSPEQASGQEVDHRSDLFALGGLIYEMLTGRAPFRGNNLLDTLWRISNEEPEPIAGLRPETPADLARLVDLLLAKNPAERPPNARAVAAELQRVAAFANGQVAVPPPGSRPAAAGPLSAISETAPAIRILVRSGALAGTEGIEAEADLGSLAARHDRLARDLLARYDGLEIDKGDGFFLLFERPGDAVAYALAYHRAVAALEPGHGVELRAPVAIHLGEVVLRPNLPADVARGAKPLEIESAAAAVVSGLLSLARGRQTLMTRAVFDLARRAVSANGLVDGELRWLAHGSYLFADLAEAEDLCEVGEVGFAPLTPPPATAGARRAVAPGDEVVLGWRPAPDQPVPRRRHWILRQRLGQGGFGEVWLAAHEKTHDKRVFKFCFEAGRLRALHREVTLFRLLRETLGHREDIARILEWNFDEPPYTLESEYTEGGNLADWAAEQGGIDKVPLATRLELLAQAAEALAAAHSVGVLHKDVKPENVLVNPGEGRPQAVLTDFGIGMLTDSSLLDERGITRLGITAVTAAGAADTSSAGTTLYMAPELLAGVAPTIQSDVYSLGVMLYQLVVGDLHRPLAPGWRREVEDELLRDDVAAFADGSPEQRPRTAFEVAERLRTLEARRAAREAERGAREKAVKARRRRKLLAGVAAVSAVFAVVVLVLALQALDARAQAVRARIQAEELVDFMLFDLRDSLDAIGRLDLLEGVAHSSREYFDSVILGGERGGSVYKRGISLLNVGDVLLEQGDTEAAAASFRLARTLFETALADDPARRDWRRGLSKSRVRIGNVLLRQGDGAASLLEYRAALATARALVSEEPQNPELRYELAYCYYRLGWWHYRSEDNAATLEACRQALSLAEAVAAGPDGAHWRNGLLIINVQTLIAKAHTASSDLKADREAALEAHTAVRVLASSLAAEDPGNSNWPRRLAWAHFYTGEIQSDLGDLPAALDSLRAALSAFAVQAATDPTRSRWFSAQAAAQVKIGRIHRHRDDLTAALEAFQTALGIYEKIAAEDPTTSIWQEWLVLCHREIGAIHVLQGETPSVGEP